MCALKIEHLSSIALDEQQLCKKCGLCCNGTLFGSVRLTDEDMQHITEHIPDLIIQDSKKPFKQPCRYYQGKSCSIYSGWRPNACSTFVCKLLIRYRQKKISFTEAINVIEQTVERAEHVRKRLSIVAGDNKIALTKLFDEYVVSHPNPDQILMLEYGVIQFILKRDFRKNVKTQDSDDEKAEDGQ